MTEITEAERRDHIESIAADHVRKGFYDDNDLKILGITRDEAESAYRERSLRQTVGYIQSLDHRHRDDFMAGLLTQVYDKHTIVREAIGELLDARIAELTTTSGELTFADRASALSRSLSAAREAINGLDLSELSEFLGYVQAEQAGDGSYDFVLAALEDRS